jgi:hypothetical protein
VVRPLAAILHDRRCQYALAVLPFVKDELPLDCCAPLTQPVDQHKLVGRRLCLFTCIRPTQ